MSTLSAAITASASALNVERARIEVAVSNMANADSTRSADGQPYRRRDVMLTADPVESFDAALGKASATGVKVAGIVEDRMPFRKRYEPSHPDADAEGFVSLPNVDASEEMVDMLGAARAYQANLAAIGMIREMVAKALELGEVIVPFEVLGTRSGASSAFTRGAKAAVTGGTDAGAFAEKLGELVEHVEDTAAEANVAINGMIDKSVDVHEAMLALTKAEQTFQLTVQIRNKLVQAYQDIMRMPV